MSAFGEKLTAKQERAIAALLSERTHDDAAKKANVNPRTLRRWLQLDAFRAAYRDGRAAAFDGVLLSLQRLGEKAVEALGRGITGNASADEIRAARVVLEFAFKGIEMYELADRLAAVEKLVAEQAEQKGKR